MSSIPSDTVFDDLLSAAKTKFEAIETVKSVIIGTFDPVLLAQYAEQASSTYFPCIEILTTGFTGEEYISQRDIRGNYAFQFVGHQYAAVKSRIDGDDMKAIEHLGTAMRIAMYSFIDDVSAPCTGFLFANPDYTGMPVYQEYAENINSYILSLSFKCERADTSA